MKTSSIALSILLLLTSADALADTRHASQHAAFMRENPCPATGATRGKCAGYVVDHIKPLCADGADKPENMQWQEVGESREKDKLEWATCRALRRGLVEVNQ